VRSGEGGSSTRGVITGTIASIVAARTSWVHPPAISQSAGAKPSSSVNRLE